ncbi:MAG TPA: hypothetical protein VJ323_08155 [Bryobacteraceae bacterium]|jgi:hypothetical protein|nr:hypothetical protein [Bryobacteraceae bacterium]
MSPETKRDIAPTAEQQTHAAKPSLLDRSFVYVDAAHTDIRVTFDRIRKQMEATSWKPTTVRGSKP